MTCDQRRNYIPVFKNRKLLNILSKVILFGSWRGGVSSLLDPLFIFLIRGKLLQIINLQKLKDGI